jgi:hypothetical protein
MVSHAINAHEKQADAISKFVWFEGSTALLEGQAVCYNWDFGTASASDARRFSKVEVPSTTNAQWFAGVCARPYSANTGGQMIEIYVPGSVCNVLSGANTTIGVGRLTFEITAVTATNGSFRNEGMEGEGSCIPLQTVDRSSTDGLCLVKLDPPGRPSGGFETVQLVDNTAFVAMVGGTTGIVGATLGTGDATETLADGAIAGLRKKFKCITTEIATNDAVITVTTGRSHALADSALASVTFAGASTCLNTSVTLEWDGAWIVQNLTKTMPALA